MQTGLAPVELKTKATKQFQADLKKYADTTGIPDYGLYTGYMSCELALLGLKNAGNPPTRAAFAPNLRKVGSYDGAGLRANRSTSAPRHSGRPRRPTVAGSSR